MKASEPTKGSAMILKIRALNGSESEALRSAGLPSASTPVMAGTSSGLGM